MALSVLQTDVLAGKPGSAGKVASSVAMLVASDDVPHELELLELPVLLLELELLEPPLELQLELDPELEPELEPELLPEVPDPVEVLVVALPEAPLLPPPPPPPHAISNAQSNTLTPILKDFTRVPLI